MKEILAVFLFSIFFHSAYAKAQDKAQEIPYALQDAKVGQWAKYRLGGVVTLRAEIIDIDDQGNTKIKVESWRDGKLVHSGVDSTTLERAKENRSELLAVIDVVSIEHTTRIVLGREIPVTILTRAISEDENEIMILSKEVPVYGEVLIKGSHSDTPLSELIEYKK
ncbi:MAG: hypothetical protein LIQ31_12250 [Planctomycetes bacterium]|nr:hypothetical protein [Planctomycetota bacterium]